MKDMKLKTKIIVSSACVVLVALVLCLVVMASSSNIYKGISVCGINVGGLDAEAAEQKLKDEVFFDKLPAFTCNDREFEIEPFDISLDCNAKETALFAKQYGKDKNPFVRIANSFKFMFSPVDLPIIVSYDEPAFEAEIDKYISDLRTPSVEPEIRVEGDKLYIKNGSQGLDVNKEKLSKDLANVAGGKKDKIELVIETVNPTPISAQALFDEYSKEVVNADYEISGMRIKYTESEEGISFDVKEAEKIIEENLKNSKEYFIPLTIVKPNPTTEELDKSLFGDCLGTYTTRYNPGEIGRTKNVNLAAKSINNIVLKKGDVFSYNNILGERTEARGYSGAKVYAGGEVVDGLGGGICQVSSTLYNAVLFADLTVVSRTCHSLPVAYVPLGRDATVSYGSIDFKFKNPYDDPIKISAVCSGGVLTVGIYGKKQSDKTVEISTERISTIPFETVERPDETIAVGETKVKQSGSDGAVVKTYKKVIENGKVTSSKMIHTSRYNPINKIILVPPVVEEPPVEELPGELPTEEIPEVEEPDISQDAPEVKNPAEEDAEKENQ